MANAMTMKNNLNALCLLPFKKNNVNDYRLVGVCVCMGGGGGFSHNVLRTQHTLFCNGMFKCGVATIK